jgi:hypothetical protein
MADETARLRETGLDPRLALAGPEEVGRLREELAALGKGPRSDGEQGWMREPGRQGHG